MHFLRLMHQADQGCMCAPAQPMPTRIRITKSLLCVLHHAGFPVGSEDMSAVEVAADGSLHLGLASAAAAPSANPMIPSSDPSGSGSPGGLPAALPAQPQPWQQEAPPRASASSLESWPGLPPGPGEVTSAAALAAFASRRQVGALVADWDLEAGSQVGAPAANMYASAGADAHALLT